MFLLHRNILFAIYKKKMNSKQKRLFIVFDYDMQVGVITCLNRLAMFPHRKRQRNKFRSGV